MFHCFAITISAYLFVLTGIASFTLSQPPVNSLDGEFLTNIADTMKNLEKDSSVSGILVTSKFHGKVFSSGLNIFDMFDKYSFYV